MFQEVTLVDHRPGEVRFETVRARQFGRAYTWRDEENTVFGLFLLFEGEDGRWFVQKINYFPEPHNFSVALYFVFTSFEDVKCTFPREVRYITGDASAQATFYPEPQAADRA